MYIKGASRLNRFLWRYLGYSFEVVNTSLPEHQHEARDTLWSLLKIPRMSTFAIGAMINQGVKQMAPNTCFVNVGVWNGFTFLAGMAGNPDKACIGIDNFSQFGGPKEQFLHRFHQHKSSQHVFYDMDYEEYFAKIHKEKALGFYIYDGEHSYKNQLKGLQVAEPFFSKNCIILVDDTNSKEPRQATLDFMNNSAYEYLVILDKTTRKGDHPTLWCGVMVLQRLG